MNWREHRWSRHVSCDKFLCGWLSPHGITALVNANQHEKLQTEATPRLKRAELMSALGAGLIGFGLGALTASFVAHLAALALIAGALMHGWGMYDKRAAERDLGRAKTIWMRALYWSCWLILAGLAAALIFRIFR